MNNDSFAELLKADPLLGFLNVHKVALSEKRAYGKQEGPETFEIAGACRLLQADVSASEAKSIARASTQVTVSGAVVCYLRIGLQH